MSLDSVVEALGSLSGTPPSPPNHIISGSDEQQFFSVEDALLAGDVSVSVEGVGAISFPITENKVKEIVSVSEKALFGKGEVTLLDTTVRDTQVIPAKKLKVIVNETSLKNVLERVAQELKLRGNCKLVPHLYNMLIYGPGQFFKEHQDTEKVSNMVATLIIVLPSPHKGGDLFIRHNKSIHRFFGSSNPNIIKCVAFYSDCFHQVKPVEEGFRVALTYNIELQSSALENIPAPDNQLRSSIAMYFKDTDNDKLVYLLDHEYTKRSLRWGLIKGEDRARAYALFAVARADGYSPCLALTEHHEQKLEDDYDCNLESDTKAYFWVDQNEGTFDYDLELDKDETCFSTETAEIFDPYKEEEGGGYQGNWSEPKEYWYRRACVVLWENNFVYPHGCEIELKKLHKLTMEDGNLEVVRLKIKALPETFFQRKNWTPFVKSMFLDIVVYLNDADFALKIFSKLPPKIVLDFQNTELISWIIKSINLDYWQRLVSNWKSVCKMEVMFESVLSFLEKYIFIDNKDFSIGKYLYEELVFFLTFSFSLTSSEYIKKLTTLTRLGKCIGEDNAELDIIEKMIKTSLSRSITCIDDVKKLREALSPEQFEQVLRSSLIDKVAESTLAKMATHKPLFLFSEPNQSNIKEVCNLLQTLAELGVKTSHENCLINLIVNNSAFTPIFLGNVVMKLRCVLSAEKLEIYETLRTGTLKLINRDLGNLGSVKGWWLPVSVPCTCHYCAQVNTFFASPTENYLVIPTAKDNRRHIYSHLNPLQNLPIKFETLRVGSPFKLTVEKLPELLKCKENWKKQLLVLQKSLMRPVENVDNDGAPTLKVLIKEEVTVKSET